MSFVKASMAQLAERSAVNRQVLGSIPSGGVFFIYQIQYLFRKQKVFYYWLKYYYL